MAFSTYTIYMSQEFNPQLNWHVFNKAAILNTVTVCTLTKLINTPSTSNFIFSTKYGTFDYLDIIAFNLFDENIGVTILLLTVLIVALFGCLELCRIKDKNY